MAACSARVKRSPVFSLFSARAFSAHPSRSLRAAENQHKRWEIWPPTLAALQRNGQPPCHGSAELKMTISAAERYRSKWDVFFFSRRAEIPPPTPLPPATRGCLLSAGPPASPPSSKGASCPLSARGTTRCLNRETFSEQLICLY